MAQISMSFNTENLSFSATIDGQSIENLSTIGYETFGEFGSLWIVTRSFDENKLFFAKRMSWEWERPAEGEAKASPLAEARFSEKELSEAEYNELIQSEAAIPMASAAKTLFQIINNGG